MHVQNANTKQHSVVEYAKKSMPGNASSPLCPLHDGKDCLYWCQTCGNAVCVDCKSSLHNGHEFINLAIVLLERRENLQKELQSLESNDLKEWEDLIVEAKKATTDFLDRVSGTEKDLKEREIDFQKEVNKMFENIRMQLKELKTSHLAFLRKREKMASDGFEKVKLEIKECEDRLRNNDIESLLEHKGDRENKQDILPAICYANPPVFSPSLTDTKSLARMFGKITKQVVQAGKSESIQASSTEILYQKSVSNDENPTLSQGQLIPEPSVESEFNAGNFYPSLASAGPGRAWVKAGDTELQLMKGRGTVKDTIETDFSFDDLVISPHGDIFLSNMDTNSIMSISFVKVVKTLFKTQMGWLKTSKPYGLCYLQSGDIAVTFADVGRVVI